MEYTGDEDEDEEDMFIFCLEGEKVIRKGKIQFVQWQEECWLAQVQSFDFWLGINVIAEKERSDFLRAAVKVSSGRIYESFLFLNIYIYIYIFFTLYFLRNNTQGLQKNCNKRINIFCQK